MRLAGACKWGVVGLFVLSLAAGVAEVGAYAAGRSNALVVGAAKQADAAAVRALLKDGADVNAPEIDGTTALHWAVHNDAPELVDLLLVAGARADATNRYGITPLWLAATNGNSAIVTKLLGAGADARAARASSGETTLMIAARSGHADVMRLLIEHGADVNAVESHRGQTALMWAAAERHPSAVKLLLEAGANMHARSGRTEMTPLMFAVRSGDIETTRLFLDAGADLTQLSSEGASMLVVAVLNANFELANFLLERGADPNIDGPHGTPLFVLTWLRSAINRSLTATLVRTPTGNMDSFDLGKALLARGADINARIGEDKEPELETPETAGGDESTEAEDDETDENAALPYRRRMWMPRNLAIGPYFVSFAGATPFYIAAINCDVPYMTFLAEAGADTTIPTRQNVTPLLAASGIGFYEGEHPGDPEVCLEAVKLAYELGNDPLAAVDYAGHEVGSPNWDGATALHGAATRGANEMVKWLVEKGVPLGKTTNLGMTAWDIADGSNITGVFHRWIETATLLRWMMEENGLPIEASPARGLKTY